MFWQKGIIYNSIKKGVNPIWTNTSLM